MDSVIVAHRDEATTAGPSGIQTKPYDVRVEDGRRYVVLQVWEFHGSIYDLAVYFVDDSGSTTCTAQVMRSPYYAVGTGRLLELMEKAGFEKVQRLDERFYQPVLHGRKPRA